MKYKKGFTLAELLVSFAIIAAISSVIIYNHKKFNDNLEITNLSYEVALILRQAQVYGMSVRDFKEGINTSEENRFTTPYGVYFSTLASGNDANNKSFVFFADVDKDGIYQSGTDVSLQKIDIGRGNYISSICSKEGGSWDCSVGSPAKRDKVGITFTRPDPDAIFKFGDGTVPSIVKICLQSPQNRIKEIVVYTTGQISIVDGECFSLSGEEGIPGGGGDTGAGKR
jgi:prepilin-type N-terminal cleavage/methylation domain-containing protein